MTLTVETRVLSYIVHVTILLTWIKLKARKKVDTTPTCISTQVK